MSAITTAATRLGPATSRRTTWGEDLVAALLSLWAVIGLFLDGFDDARVAVPGRADGDAGREIAIAIAVDVLHLGALAMIHDERIIARIRR